MSRKSPTQHAVCAHDLDLRTHVESIQASSATDVSLCSSYCFYIARYLIVEYR